MDGIEQVLLLLLILLRRIKCDGREFCELL